MSRYIEADALIMALRLEYPMMPMFKENQQEWGIKTEGYRKAEEVIKNAPSIDIADYVPKDFHDKTCEAMAKAHQEEIANMVSVVRCKECKWYDPPHILHKDGTRTDVDEDAPWVTVDVGINCGGQCIHHIDLKTYCFNHDRENPDDNERIVIFRKPDDYCSYGEREGE